MKKALKGLLIASALIAASCGNSETKTDYTIGICNYVSDASLDQIVSNIESVLSSQTDVTFKYIEQNAQADTLTANQIISDFEAKNVDLMVGVATPIAIAMQSATEDSKTPVVFAAVSDPVACGIVKSLDNPGGNITGTSDYLDTNAIMNLITAKNPSIKKVGLLYDIGQDSSTTPIAAAKKYLDEHNIAYVEKTGTNTTEIIQAADDLVKEKVEAIFTPSDNTVMTAELSIYQKFEDAKIPHYAGADSFALNGAFCGYGVDYANLGKVTGEMVVDILKNKKDVASYSVRTFDNGTATINTDVCSALGYDINEVKNTFAPLCTEVKTLTTKESF